jgi:hypothetical protein
LECCYKGRNWYVNFLILKVWEKMRNLPSSHLFGLLQTMRRMYKHKRGKKKMSHFPVIFIAEEDKKLNATYIISVARKLGCSIFLLPEDIIEVKLSL